MMMKKAAPKLAPKAIATRWLLAPESDLSGKQYIPNNPKIVYHTDATLTYT